VIIPCINYNNNNAVINTNYGRLTTRYFGLQNSHCRAIRFLRNL